MKVILFFAVLLAHFVTTFSSTAILYTNSSYNGLCVIDDIHPKIILKPGENHKLPPCGKISCKKSGVAVITGCSIETPPEDCYFDGYANLDAPFPYCCIKRVFC